jgi:hypothetical protein
MLVNIYGIVSNPGAVRQSNESIIPDIGKDAPRLRRKTSALHKIKWIKLVIK